MLENLKMLIFSIQLTFARFPRIILVKAVPLHAMEALGGGEDV
jgi:hypothetical protein